MKIAITDANIFIDLIYVGFLDKLFAIELEIHTTLNVVDELHEIQQKALSRFSRKGRLIVHVLEELNVSTDIGRNGRLSESDKSVLTLAIQLDAFILTGDNLVRRVSGVQRIEVHGVLWLFDQFLDKNLITRKRAIRQLTYLRAYNRRLPSEECEKRIAKWSGQLSNDL